MEPVKVAETTLTHAEMKAHSDMEVALVLDRFSVVSSVAFWDDGVKMTLADGRVIVLMRDIAEAAVAKMKSARARL